MAGPNGDGGKQGLEVGEVTLLTFQTRMQKLVDELKGSPAEHTKIGEQKVTAASYGTGFSAASEMHGAYEKVRTRLEELTKIFGETIEAMGIRAQIAHKGYDNVNQEQRDRYRQILETAREDYRKQHPAETQDPAKPAKPTADTDSGGFS
ncbi:hypothetical protein [Streptomyces roseicoloratus]|uniref:Conjugal transfer protein TraB n=1 Tax=Streptomyces roseicoloratus TaxID=2508722 RepID=A0ABY9RRF7_9ACTN|nr:hypothetical protein [Streptomyces roseicoloratus]WMX44769.1 hypothetical protein RGF97_07740 [Streptomyces roseicoloratus]